MSRLDYTKVNRRMYFGFMAASMYEASLGVYGLSPYWHILERIAGKRTPVEAFYHSWRCGLGLTPTETYYAKKQSLSLISLMMREERVITAYRLRHLRHKVITL